MFQSYAGQRRSNSPFSPWSTLYSSYMVMETKQPV